MIETIAFRTQARTLDHLGREQIADCPTAISELWKNAYDAYAKSVSLHIFDSKTPVAAIFDDGHGMNFDEFVNRWLVVGSEAKYNSNDPDLEDRQGLPKRTKQGQKGIGRLSCANLGPLLLVVSKRKKNDFVAALIDWRIFENPYLLLSDIQIPVTTFSIKNDLFEQLPQLLEKLTENIWGAPNDGGSSERSMRLVHAWKLYDQYINSTDLASVKPSDAIANTIIESHFDQSYLSKWSVWEDASDQGTALLVSDINYDLLAQLPSFQPDGAVNSIREHFFETLSAFTDPLVDDTAAEINAVHTDFNFEIRIWSGDDDKVLLSEDTQAYSRSVTDEMEHVISGNVDEHGVFRGQIKAFGSWQKMGEDYTIYPKQDLNIPSGPNTRLGQFSIYIAAYERKRINSSHTDEEYNRYNELAVRYGGLRIYRNGLRVLPYGRVDNDFFKIEQRRSVSAGREFWNARRMFSRIAISREQNPNLKDKAGREGFIDNRSAKALREIIINILRHSAYEYLGQASDIRLPSIEEIREKNELAKIAEQRKKLFKRNRQMFNRRLKENLPLVEELSSEILNVRREFEVSKESEISVAQSKISDFNSRLKELRITGAPKNLGSKEASFRKFHELFQSATTCLNSMQALLTNAIEDIQPLQPESIAQQEVDRLQKEQQSKIRMWRKQIEKLQADEQERVSTLLSSRSKLFHNQTVSTIHQVKTTNLDLNKALDGIASLYEEISEENEDLFGSYVNTLESLSDSINIDILANQNETENSDLREQINRLNHLAQLGITVEILGHELTTHEHMIKTGIKKVKVSSTDSGIKQIELGFKGLSQQLEFLSPLKISGNRAREKITGKDIITFVTDFFNLVSRNHHIEIEASPEFELLNVIELRSRILPVFINLLNNSIYWMVHSQTKNPRILFSIVEDAIVVSDNGPGINEIDQKHLFSLFFTTKTSGGRGVGLYLCRANLAAGNHQIHYATDSKYKKLHGANFVIRLKGMDFD